MSAIANSSPGGPKKSSLGQIKKPSVDATPWCYTGTKADTNFSFAWTIKMEVYKIGECLTSDTFKMEVEGVEVGVFPQWEAEDRRGHRGGRLRVSVPSQGVRH